MTKLIVIGGGASGLIAGICAARNGIDVTILEKEHRLARKILATGNGRCNFTNINSNISRFHGKDPKFALSALNIFDHHYAISFFEELGITHKLEDEGKVFPQSEQAASIVEVLMMELERLKIKVILNKEVEKISKNKDFKILCKDKSTYKCDKLIIAAGGKASPKLGSDGSGLKLLADLGHKIVEPFPSLVQVILDTSSRMLNSIKGVKVQGSVKVKTKLASKTEVGEILFTEDGVSGPPILQISRLVSQAKLLGEDCYLTVDSFPTYTSEELAVNIQMRMAYRPNKTLNEFLIGLVNKKLIRVILNEAGLKDLKRKSSSLTSEEVNNMVSTMKSWTFKTLGTRQWDSAQVMAGGVSTEDVNPQTLESLKVPGLYLTGELLDIDGDCGGFNLQWAWASGYVAGNSVKV